MHAITLICTVHTANGKCNVEQLTRILQALAPDVVFQEIHPSHDWSLEAQAVTHYRKFKVCQMVYVDEYEAPADAVEIKRLLEPVMNFGPLATAS
jgi:hypothetical protein